MFRNMKIGLRMGLGFAVLLAIMVVLIGVSLHQMTVSHDKLRRIIEINNVRVSLANCMIDDMREVSIDLRNILLLQDNAVATEMKGKIAEQRQNYDENLKNLEGLIPKDDLKPHKIIAKIKALQGTSRELNDQVVALAVVGQYAEAITLMNTQASLSVRQWIHSLNDLIRYNEEYNTLRYQQANEAQAAARRFMFVLGTCALVLAAGTGILLTTGIVRPLRQMAEIAVRVGNGDLDNTLGYTFTDEIGDLAQSIDLMIDNLRSAQEKIRQRQQEMEDVQGEISGAINMLASSSNQILAQTSQLATSSSETATAIAETTATMEEVKQTSRQMSERAAAVSEAAQGTAETSEVGRRSVQETIAGMGRIKGQMDVVAGNIVRLSEQSQTIGTIIDSVNDLANQSNLLAVNASIEATKAGEEGKGFVVVAQEVRRLAEQSKDATIQVRAILGEIQKAISGAVMATDQGTKAVEAGLVQSQASGESIGRIAEEIVKAAQAALQISVGTNEQVVGIDQVSSAMENIKKATEQIVASTKQSEESSRGLHELGLKLKKMVEKYK